MIQPLAGTCECVWRRVPGGTGGYRVYRGIGGFRVGVQGGGHLEGPLATAVRVEPRVTSMAMFAQVWQV